MKNNNPIVLIKIGGSLITDKNSVFSLEQHALDIICDEVKKSLDAGKKIILGHGAGSFGHFPAKKYQTHKGFIGPESLFGMSEVADAATQLNRIVVATLLKKGVPAVSLSPLSMIVSHGSERQPDLFFDAIMIALDKGILPVVYGDVVMDTEQGCTIFSTERVLGILALDLLNRGEQIERIIHCGKTNGVYDEHGKTIDCITSQTFQQVRSALGGSHGTDVTGGMLQKVEETLALAKQGIPGLIIDGIEHGSLSKAIRGEMVLGTRIEQ